MSDDESGPWLGLRSHHPQCLFFIHDDPCPCDCHVARIAELEELAKEGWGYADDYFQHKWLEPERLAAWFPNNRYLKATDDD